MPKHTTLQDVADHAGVSIATVSAVINDKPVVKESTRRRVLDSVIALNHGPPEMRRRLREALQKSVGLIVKEAQNPYYLEIADGARSYLRDKHYELLVSSSEGNNDGQMNLLALFKSQGSAGVIVSPVLHEQSDLSYLFELNRTGYPLVLLEEVRGLQADLVTVSNTESSRITTKHLIDTGHTRIVHFAGPPYTLATQERIDGFQLAFSESHLRYQRDFIVSVGALVEDGYEKGLAFFRNKDVDERPTAVNCFNDYVAMGVYKALSELGIEIPDEVSIIGHDGVSTLDFLPVPISSASSHPRERGRKAAELLIRRIESTQPLPPQRVIQDVELIVRQSVRGTKEGHAGIRASVDGRA